MSVPYLADWCSVHLVEEDGVTSRAAAAHSDPTRRELIEEMHRRWPIHLRRHGVVREALRTGTTQIVESTDQEFLARTTEEPDHADLLRRIGVGCSLVVPLKARGRTIGAVSFVRGDASRRYGPDERTLAEELGARAALALDNARLFRTVRDAEHRLRVLVHGLDAVLWEACPQRDTFSFVSQQAEEILGYPVGRWLNEPGFWRSIVHPDDRDEAVRAREEATARGEDHELEFRALRADGRPIWIRQTVHVTVDEEGRPSGTRGLMLDVTDRKREELRRAAEHAVVWVLASSTTLQEATPRLLQSVCESLGWTSGALWVADEEAGVMRLVELWSTRPLEAFAEASRTARFARGESVPGLVWATREPNWIEDVEKDPDFRRAEAATRDGLHSVFAVPVLAGDRVLGALEFCHSDIPRPDPDLVTTMAVLGSQIGQFIERKRAEVRLRESETRKKAILDAALEGVVTIDQSGIILEWNPACQQVFGYAPEEAVGRLLSQLIIPPELRAEHEQGLERFRQSGKTRIVGRPVEMPAIRADGTRILCELTITKVDLPSGSLFTGYLHDISLRNQQREQLAFQRTLLTSLSEATTEGIVVLGTDGGLLYHNQRFVELFRVPEEVMAAGRPDEIFARALSRIRGTADIFRPLERLTEPEQQERAEVTLSDGDVLDVWTTPLLGEDGTVHGRAWYFRDVSDQKTVEADLRASEERAGFLSRASELLSTSLDTSATLRRVPELAIPELGDVCLLDLLERDGSVRRVTYTFVDASDDVVVRHPDTAYARPGPGGVIGQVLRTGRAAMVEADADELETYVREEELISLWAERGIGYVLSAPMVARGRTLGVLTFGTSGAPFEESRVHLAEALAQRGALALDNARLYEDRTQVAQTLQQSLLPPHLPAVPGLEVSARYHPAGHGAEVGGDFYDIFRLEDRTWGLAIGDVCGKGAGAAVLTALARYTLRAAAIDEQNPARILSTLNEAILSQPVGDRFCTVAFARLEPGENRARLALASGGHPLPYVLRHDGRIEKVGRTGTILGLFPDPDVHDVVVALAPGDAIIFYTDGVTEGRGPSTVFGEGMLLSLLGWCKGLDAVGIAERIENTVVSFQKGTPSDDVAVLVLRVPPA